ncbi:MAG TPA: hypothetical protein VHM70_27995 [Polyangiaceae bacterium]|nr:hypothetical protein [Polyangiaceae bacterium]
MPEGAKRAVLFAIGLGTLTPGCDAFSKPNEDQTIPVYGAPVAAGSGPAFPVSPAAPSAPSSPAASATVPPLTARDGGTPARRDAAASDARAGDSAVDAGPLDAANDATAPLELR